MSWLGALYLVSALLYFGGGLVGWGLCFLARKSPRYYPALTLVGMGIGILPTYLCLVRVLRMFGIGQPPVDEWQMLALCVALAASTASGAAGLYHVKEGNRTFTEWLRAQVAQGGC